MKKILYIGNKLSKHGNTATSIETLGVFLESDGYPLIYSSDKKNKILRLLDMVKTTITNRKAVFVILIDVYSTQNFWYALIVSQLCRIINKPYVAKLHGGNLPSRLSKNPFLCDLIFKNSTYNIAPSMYLLHPFKNNYPANTKFIANTIDIIKYPFLIREKVTPNILWVRSFSSIYNPEMAIRSMAFLKNKFPNISLTMVGPDKENLVDKCEQLAKKLNVEVHFTGKLEKEEWIALSSNFSVFINTSNFDNMPISLIEAMALGLPVVSTNVGGIPFLAENNVNALLVNPDDEKAMANAVEQFLLDSDLRINLTIQARKMVEKLDWKIVKNKWKVILDNMQ